MPNTPSATYEGQRDDNHVVTVTRDGALLDPRLDLRAHSPDGFNFGFAGSGPAQLALAILADALGDDELALANYQKFEFGVIAKLKETPWRITQSEVRTWIADVLAKCDAAVEMDPTAALRDLLDALRTHDRETAFARLEALLDGLRQGGAMPTVPEPETRYQGWSNHATWAVSLWLHNDEGVYLFCRRLAREAVEDADDCDQVRDGIWTADQARRFMLADRLKEYLAEWNPLEEQPSLFSDLLIAALDEVNYDEVADAFLDE